MDDAAVHEGRISRAGETRRPIADEFDGRGAVGFENPDQVAHRLDRDITVPARGVSGTDPRFYRVDISGQNEFDQFAAVQIRIGHNRQRKERQRNNKKIRQTDGGTFRRRPLKLLF